MSEVEVRLSQLRKTSEQLHQSSRRIHDSVLSASDSIDSLLALGGGTPDFQQRYLSFRTRMYEWADTLEQFAEKLTDAADDIEGARGREGFYPGFHVSLRRRERLRPYMPEASRAPVDPTPVLWQEKRLTPDGYISQKNRALYEQWTTRKDELNGREMAYASLIETRESKQADLNALKNRLHSYDPNTDVNSIPRVQAMQTEIAQLDKQIVVMENEINVMRARVERLETRLTLVAPGAGADMDYLTAMEHSDSPTWLSQNTFDCVQHVVGKFHVPPNLAVDAHLWDDMAANFPQYGVTVGDTPLEGAVLMMTPEHGYADDVYGHVMYVEKVIDGEVWITDNYHPDEMVRLTDVTSEVDGENIRYLYFPWHTKA